MVYFPSKEVHGMEITRLASLSAAERDLFLDRKAGTDDIIDDVDHILSRVKQDGDVALREFTREFDGIDMESIEITTELDGACARVDDSIAQAIAEAASNIRSFHEAQRPDDWQRSFEGRTLGRKHTPIDRVGIYVPGGTAAYPSSALMGVIPAVVAGVPEICVVTPPGDPMNPVTLAALEIAGPTRVFSVGGAHAIGALAYGTETISPVELIAGPGNRWVTTAKQLVRSTVAIDFLAGPSEILIIADESANPAFVAADLVAQAEHDPDSSVVLVTPSESLADTVQAHVDVYCDETPRSDIVRDALAGSASGIVLVEDLAAATEFANEYGPEHLSLQTSDPNDLLQDISNAGSVFLGEYSPVAAGDYASGPNHVLPTGGQAKTTGGLSVDTFLRSFTVQDLDKPALESISTAVTTLASAEGLHAHAESVSARFDSPPDFSPSTQ